MAFRWYNDGVKEYQVFDGDPILEHWERGRIKRICYTNGEITVRILPSETPPTGFVTGRAPIHISEETEQQRRQKLRNTLNNRTVEQKQASANKARSTKQSRYGSSGYNNVEKRRATCLEKYGNENYSNRELFAKTLAEKSAEDKQRSNTKRSITLKQFHQNASSETKKRLSDARKGRKVSSETKERLRSAWTEDKISTMLEKYSNTCQQKYGVPYFCMSEKCRQSSTSNSGPNKRFSDILKNHQISYSTEFFIDHYSFDFKIDNNLVEIDPFATHNSTWSPFGESTKKDKYYHKNKSDTAKENGYRCIHVWDWDDIDKIVMLLKQRDKE